MFYNPLDTNAVARAVAATSDKLLIARRKARIFKGKVRSAVVSSAPHIPHVSEPFPISPYALPFEWECELRYGKELVRREEACSMKHVQELYLPSVETSECNGIVSGMVLVSLREARTRALLVNELYLPEV